MGLSAYLFLRLYQTANPQRTNPTGRMMVVTAPITLDMASETMRVSDVSSLPEMEIALVFPHIHVSDDRKTAVLAPVISSSKIGVESQISDAPVVSSTELTPT